MSDYSLAAAIDHIEKQDNTPADCEYRCCSCNEGFDGGHGVQIGDEEFCKICIAEFKQIDFYKEYCGLDDQEIFSQLQLTRDL